MKRESPRESIEKETENKAAQNNKKQAAEPVFFDSETA